MGRVTAEDFAAARLAGNKEYIGRFREPLLRGMSLAAADELPAVASNDVHHIFCRAVSPDVLIERACRKRHRRRILRHDIHVRQSEPPVAFLFEPPLRHEVFGVQQLAVITLPFSIAVDDERRITMQLRSVTDDGYMPRGARRQR